METQDGILREWNGDYYIAVKAPDPTCLGCAFYIIETNGCKLQHEEDANSCTVVVDNGLRGDYHRVRTLFYHFKKLNRRIDGK